MQMHEVPFPDMMSKQQKIEQEPTEVDIGLYGALGNRGIGMQAHAAGTSVVWVQPMALGN